MAIINRPYQDKLYQALNVYRDTMRAFIMRQFQENSISAVDAISASLGEEARWRFQKARGERDDIETAFDINWFRSIIDRSWSEAFASEFADREILHEFDAISEVRNLVAHPQKRDINRKRAYAGLEQIAHVLHYIGDEKEQSKLKEIIDGHPDVQPTPIALSSSIADEEMQQIAESVAQRFESAIDKVRTSGNLSQSMQSSVKEHLADQLEPFIHALNSAQGQVTDEIVERIGALITTTTTDQHPQNDSHYLEEIIESVSELTQRFRVLHDRITDAMGASTNVVPPSPLSPSTPSKPQLEEAAASTIADKWTGIVDELRTIKVKQFNLGSLLRDCRPVDVWIQRDPEKLILPFRHDFHLRSMEEVLNDSRGREQVEKAIANHFGRALDFECVLENPLPF